MNDIFLGPLTATCALTTIFRRREDIEIYTKKVQGPLFSIAQLKDEASPTTYRERAIKIEALKADFADELLSTDLSNIHARLPLAARALYDTTEKTPVKVTIIQPQRRPSDSSGSLDADERKDLIAKFTDAVANEDGTVNRTITKTTLNESATFTAASDDSSKTIAIAIADGAITVTVPAEAGTTSLLTIGIIASTNLTSARWLDEHGALLATDDTNNSANPTTATGTTKTHTWKFPWGTNKPTKFQVKMVKDGQRPVVYPITITQAG